MDPELLAGLPESFAGVEKKAGLQTPVSFRRQFCPSGCRQFDDDDKTDVVCGAAGCEGGRFDAHGKPTMEVIYWSLEDWITRMNSIPECRDELLSWWTRAQGPLSFYFCSWT